MALIKCLECKSKVSNQAKSCPSCGMEIDFEEIRGKKEEIEERKNKKIIKIAVIVGALGLLGAILSPKEAHKCDNLGAYVFLQTRGEGYFKSPSTVKFASYTSANIVSNDCKTYSIRTYADAQNAYGATVRSSVTAKVQKVNKGFEVLNIKITE